MAATKVPAAGAGSGHFGWVGLVDGDGGGVVERSDLAVRRWVPVRSSCELRGLLWWATGCKWVEGGGGDAHDGRMTTTTVGVLLLNLGAGSAARVQQQAGRWEGSSFGQS